MIVLNGNKIFKANGKFKLYILNNALKTILKDTKGVI
jgi:hypothetical protein